MYIGLQKSITSKIVQYEETGYMEKLHKIYFSSITRCLDTTGSASSGAELSFKNAAGN